MKIKITFTEEVLGTANANPDIHREFIASKSKDAEKVEEEMACLSADELMEKALAVFARDTDGTAILFDYQVRGFIKGQFKTILDFGKTIKLGKATLSRWTYKGIIDRHVHVYPRKIRIGAVTGICTRPLRAETMQGERVTLASSETVPAGTSFECEIVTNHPELDELVVKSLDMGKDMGIGGWRTGGKGRLTWEEIKT